MFKNCLQAYKPRYLTYLGLKVRPFFTIFVSLHWSRHIFRGHEKFFKLIFFMEQIVTPNFFNTSAVFGVYSKKKKVPNVLY